MFAKKELTDADIEQMKLDQTSSMRQAIESRNRFLAERIKKLKAHSQKVERLKNRPKTSHDAPEDKELSQDCLEFINNIKKIKSVEEFQSFMQIKENIDRAEKLVGFIEESQEKAALLCDQVRNRPKIFMSMMLLARFGSEVMPHPSADEQKLLKESQEFYNLLQSQKLQEELKTVAWKWSRAVLSFAEWSSKDRFTLRTKMRQDFLRWQKKIGNWQKDHHSHAEWEPHVLEYQNQIVNKIYQVFGHAEIESLKRDMQELNKTFTEADLVIEFEKEAEEYTCYWKDRSNSSFDPSKENTQLLQETRKKIQNIQILHELMLKENLVNFEKVLNMAGSGTLDEITKKNIQTITKLTVMLKDAQDPERIVGVLVDIFEYMRGALTELAGDNPDYRREIPLIDCSISQCDWVKDSEAFLQSILHYCKKCCAPVRDPQCAQIEALIQKMSTESSVDGISLALMQAISGFLELLNAMRSDFSNFRLKMLAMQLEGKGVAEKYELDYLIESTGSRFSKTGHWLSNHLHEAENPLETLAKAYLRLFDPQVEAMTNESLPETFSLDAERVQRYRNTLKSEMIAKTIGLFLQNHLKLNSTEVTGIQDKIKVAFSNEEILEMVEPIIGTSEHGTLLKGTIKRLLQNPADDKVFTLLKHREFSQIRSKMLLNKEPQLGTSIEDKIASLFRYNKACFYEIYDKILKK